MIAETRYMSAKLHRFIHRAPRYALAANEDRFMRLKKENGLVPPQEMEILDISVSGIGFLVSHDCPLEINEQIAIEFQPPKGGSSMASFAIIVRIAHFGDKRKVGAQFTGQNSTQINALAKSLSQALKPKLKIASHPRTLNLKYSILSATSFFLWLGLQITYLSFQA